MEVGLNDYNQASLTNTHTHTSPWSYSGVPLVEGLDVDEGHLPTGTGHHAIVLTADDQVNVFPQLPPPVPEVDRHATCPSAPGFQTTETSDLQARMVGYGNQSYPRLISVRLCHYETLN